MSHDVAMTDMSRLQNETIEKKERQLLMREARYLCFRACWSEQLPEARVQQGSLADTSNFAEALVPVQHTPPPVVAQVAKDNRLQRILWPPQHLHTRLHQRPVIQHTSLLTLKDLAKI